MTMTYSFEKNFDRWETEPDFFDEILVEEQENEKEANTVSLDEIDEFEDFEIEFDEEFDL
jgi:hypothetical protein